MISAPASKPEPRTEPLAAPVERLRALLPHPLRAQVRSAREMERSQREADAPPVPTAVAPLDRLLAGGLPRGQLVEIVGARSSGRFSTLLAVLAAATGVGEAAGLVDLGDGLDPAAAAAMGVDLERLLWLRPTTLKQALAGAEMLLGSGFPLVVLDLGYPPVRGGRGLEAAWLRLARAAQAHESALLVGSPYRVSGTAAAVVLKAGPARAAWSGGEGAPWLLGGLAARLAVEKCRGRLPGQGEGLDLVVAESPAPPAAPKTRSPRPARPAAVSLPVSDEPVWPCVAPAGARPTALPVAPPDTPSRRWEPAARAAAG
jgi:RecA DNA recombination protein